MFDWKRFAFRVLDLLSLLCAKGVVFAYSKIHGPAVAKLRFMPNEAPGNADWEEEFLKGCSFGLAGHMEFALAMSMPFGGVRHELANQGVFIACMAGHGKLAKRLLELGANVPNVIFELPDHAFPAKVVAARAILQIGTKDQSFIDMCADMPELADDAALCKRKMGVA